ncbi:MAG: hypothetical protein CM1200mP27_06210 [Chloroflexota bacterium]|nr:MAG: hypothetical protein CM1200mP27_06210 [Chloroflexota bacterium]
MILLKDCPKCRGDLLLCHDHYGDYFSCIQCGLIRETIPIGGWPRKPFGHFCSKY